MNYNKLYEWFDELYEYFGDQAIPPAKIENAIRKIFDYFNAGRPKKILGIGGNGIVILSTNGKVVKFTIDDKEAIAWKKLLKPIEGVPSPEHVVRLVGKNNATIIYAILRDDIAHDLSRKQRAQINRVREIVDDYMDNLLQKRRLTPEEYRKQRTFAYIREFSRLGDDFRYIPVMIKKMYDQGIMLYDFHNENFRVNDDGYVIYIDPSVPDIVGKHEGPDVVSYEQRIHILSDIRTIIM